MTKYWMWRRHQGGKTTHMASLMKNQGKIVAWDIHPHRVKLIEQNSQRLKATIVVTQVRDAQIPDEDMFNKFDKVMIDAPVQALVLSVESRI